MERLLGESEAAGPKTCRQALRTTCNAEFVRWKLGFRMLPFEAAGIGRTAACAGQRFFILWRILAAMSLSYIFIYTFVVDANSGCLRFWPFFLSDWSLTCQTIYTWLAVSESIYARRLAVTVPVTSDGAELVRPSRFAIAVWLFGNITYSLPLFVACTFWLTEMVDHNSVTTVLWEAHGLNVSFILVDAFFLARPFYLLSVWQPFLVAFTYVVWTIIAYFLDLSGEAGDDYLYTWLQWSKPVLTTSIVLAGLFVGLPLAHGVMWLVWFTGNRATGVDSFYAAAAAAREKEAGLDNELEEREKTTSFKSFRMVNASAVPA